jgi:hypothetical protein
MRSSLSRECDVAGDFIFSPCMDPEQSSIQMKCNGRRAIARAGRSGITFSSAIQDAWPLLFVEFAKMSVRIAIG